MIDEKHLEFDLFTQVELTESESPTPSGLSSFAWFYLKAYLRMLPGGVLFDDVRESANDAHRAIAFLKTADDVLPWVAFHFLFERVLPQEFFGASTWSVSALERFGLHSVTTFSSTAMSRLYFQPFYDALAAAEEDQLAEGFETILLASDKGVGAMKNRLSERLVSLLQATRMFLRMAIDRHPPKSVGAFLAIMNIGFFPRIEGAEVLAYLAKHTRSE